MRRTILIPLIPLLATLPALAAPRPQPAPPPSYDEAKQAGKLRSPLDEAA